MTANVNTTSPRSFFAPFADAARKFGEIMVDTSDLMRCKREAERLFAMSDAELAKRGLTRDRVINHAFARHMSV